MKRESDIGLRNVMIDDRIGCDICRTKPDFSTKKRDASPVVCWGDQRKRNLNALVLAMPVRC